MQFMLITAAILTAALQASAQGFSSPSAIFSGAGCPQGTASTLSVTTNAINYTPPATFSTTPSHPTGRFCTAAVEVTIPANWRFKIDQINTPVNAVTPSGNSQLVKNDYWFAGTLPTPSGSTTITGTGPFTANNVLSPTNVWSDCGGTININIKTTLRASGSAGGSVSIAGAVNSPVVWEAC